MIRMENIPKGKTCMGFHTVAGRRYPFKGNDGDTAQQSDMDKKKDNSATSCAALTYRCSMYVSVCVGTFIVTLMNAYRTYLNEYVLTYV